MNRYVFGIHRGGSSVMGLIAVHAAQITGVPLVEMGPPDATLPDAGPRGAATKTDTLRAADGSGIDGIFSPQADNWRAHQGLFVPIRRADMFPPEVFKSGDRAVLMMRDPRDCMVSGYYGFLRLHGGGLETPSRQIFYNMGIDAYVLEHMLPRYKRAVDDYIALRAQIPTLSVLHYEQMVTDFPSWLEAFLASLEMPRRLRLRERLRHQRLWVTPKKVLLDQHSGDFTPPAAEDIDHHKRQMLPGDHIRKLKPETIAAINDQMGPQLRAFGYL